MAQKLVGSMKCYESPHPAKNCRLCVCGKGTHTHTRTHIHTALCSLERCLMISEVWGGFSPEAMRFLGDLAQALLQSS